MMQDRIVTVFKGRDWIARSAGGRVPNGSIKRSRAGGAEFVSPALYRLLRNSDFLLYVGLAYFADPGILWSKPRFFGFRNRLFSVG